MPTIITHSFTGIASGFAVYNKSFPRGFWVLSVLCSVISDADVICFRLGIPYLHFFGHRGFFHSIFFACILGSLTGIILMKTGKKEWKDGLFFAGYFSFIMTLHGILDAFTNGGMGIALLSPFILKRYFSPIRPVEVSPISLRTFIYGRCFQIFQNEILWVWIPSLCISITVRILLRKLLKRS